MKLADIKINPNNPRIIKDESYKKLLKSLKEFPEMLELREIVIDENNMILGGNMRYIALQELNETECIAKQVTGLTEDQKKEFIVKDNIPFGDWNWDSLANEWDEGLLEDWGLNVEWNEKKIKEKELDENNMWVLNILFENEKECREWYNKLSKENLCIKVIL